MGRLEDCVLCKLETDNQTAVMGPEGWAAPCSIAIYALEGGFARRSKGDVSITEGPTWRMDRCVLR